MKTNRPANRLAAAATVSAAPSATDRMAAARAAREDPMSPEERAVTEQSAALKLQIDATSDATEKTKLAERRAILEKQRKGLAFVRRSGDALLKVEDVCKAISSLANTTTYNSTPDQRGKVKAAFTTRLIAALNELDKASAETAAADKKERRREAHQMAANMFR